MKRIFFRILLMVLLFAPRYVFSQASNVVVSPTGKLPGVASSSQIIADNFLPNLIVKGIGITAILAIIAITWAGIQMLLSVGDESKFQKAKNIMIFSLIGVCIAGMGYTIVRLISNISL